MASGSCDLLFRNATVHDGSGAAPAPADVAVAGDRIVRVAPPGSLAAAGAARVIDAAGLALAPGFIDAHTHDDRIVIDAPAMEPKLSQGVTTVVVGNCGISLAPVTFAGDPPPPMNLLGGREVYEFPDFAAYAARLAAVRPALNVVALVGHSALRLRTMGDVCRRATVAEVGEMCRLAAAAMAEGASGFSTGLFYPTNAAADAAEVAAVGRAVAAAEGVYATHMRDETVRVLESIDEAVTTAAEARLPLVISHHKCAGPANWGRTRETLPRIEGAAARQPVNLDVYPYTAGSTVLRADLVTADYRILVTWSKAHPEMQGRDLADIAAGWGVGLHAAAERLQPAGAIYFQMEEADVRRVMASPVAMIGSDGLPHDDHPHPRLWGTFPRVIGHYARDEGLFPVATAIHKMTGLPAAVFGLADRGRIAEGMAADLVLFDPDAIIDRATYAAPKQPAAGIAMVVVNGAVAREEGAAAARAGRLLRGRRRWRG
jgi:N-acyl-D-amino-acid deacylase